MFTLVLETNKKTVVGKALHIVDLGVTQHGAINAEKLAVIWYIVLKLKCW